MKIILINAFYIGMYGALKSAAGRYFPLGLGYIASSLIAKGHEVKIVDPEVQNLGLKKLGMLLVKEKPAIVGISCATPSFNYARQIASVVKEKTLALTVLGGTHASALSNDILQNCPEIDLVCIGEGEITMSEIADAVNKNIAWENVSGLAFRRNSEIKFSQVQPYIDKIDSIAFPARHLVKLDRYYPNAHYYRNKNSATMISSRGCPYGCIFCASFTTLGKKFRPHSPDYVLREIEHLYENYKVRYAVFNDDTFTYDKERAMEICKMIIARKLNLEWYCFARVDTIDYELLSLMKEAGCSTIGFGVESADPQILINIKKGITIEQTKQAFSIANKLKFKTLAFFIFGSPGESKETILKTIKFSKEIKPTLAFYNFLTPYPGTPIFRKQNNLFNTSDKLLNWDNFVAVGQNPVNSDFGTAVSITELKKYINLANKYFYLRPGQILKVISHIGSLFEFWINIRSSIGLLLQTINWKKKNGFNLWFKNRISPKKTAHIDKIQD